GCYALSPQDVTPLEGLTDTPETARICGDKFGAFGAFLDKKWRKHDILRGRLDGAERLIAAVLQGDDPQIASLRNQFILEAQKEIALDWDAAYGPLKHDAETRTILARTLRGDVPAAPDP